MFLLVQKWPWKISTRGSLNPRGLRRTGTFGSNFQKASTFPTIHFSGASVNIPESWVSRKPNWNFRLIDHSLLKVKKDFIIWCCEQENTLLVCWSTTGSLLKIIQNGVIISFKWCQHGKGFSSFVAHFETPSTRSSLSQLWPMHSSSLGMKNVSVKKWNWKKWKSKALDIQNTSWGSVFGPQKHILNTFSGGVWMSRGDTLPETNRSHLNTWPSQTKTCLQTINFQGFCC